ncbi:LUD domain-containing protein [Gluconobacter cerevisiae]|uniref:LUD domain-containing protein n=1 Tax=Gluconobacter cerevisiae TaxID=1379734 RepID=A0ABR9YA49_9PROT|nr:LUD domain-containing protein [Gluconobacter cerevisiae]MBF0875441.1 LUD domain-containing protein [Gluconobacter cerevisiae]
MSGSRDAILGAIRKNHIQGERPRPAVPLFDQAAPADLKALFQKSLERMGGKILIPDATDPMAPVRQAFVKPGPVVSCVPEFEGDMKITPQTKPTDIAPVEYAVLRAAFGVAETGSLCFTEKQLHVNTTGFLPQHLIVLLDPAQIVYNLHNAYQRPEWLQAHYAVFQSGPSATADIEGVLVHGAQGVRSLSVLFQP